MTYHNGSRISLGDVVQVALPGGTAKARVVMLGGSCEHLDIDSDVLAWVKRDKVLELSHVVVEWLDANPFAHDDPRYALVGNYMFLPVDEGLTPIPNHLDPLP
jgi:hypothetical protein